MKAIAYLVLLFLGSAFSQKIYTYCSFNRCPSGYKREFSGRNILNAICLCSKPDLVAICQEQKNRCESPLINDCKLVSLLCPEQVLLDYCNQGFPGLVKECDKRNEAAIKKRNEDLLNKSRQIYGTKKPFCYWDDFCKSRNHEFCSSVYDRCDVDTVVEQCKTGVIRNEDVCSDAAKKKARQDDQKTPYQCLSEIKKCMKFHNGTSSVNNCDDVPFVCDSESTAKMCYKGQLWESSEEDCAKAIKKSQELMLPVDQQKCNAKLKLCERGDYEACTEVPVLCGKEFVSALCNAKKITNKRMCTYAGLESSASTAYPGCDVFAAECRDTDDFYCGLASRYCDNETIVTLCDRDLISDVFKCARAKQSISK